jgi:hypothetical protein
MKVEKERSYKSAKFDVGVFIEAYTPIGDKKRFQIDAAE